MNINPIKLARALDPTIRFHEQFAYGNREILLDYLSLPRNHIILGNLQSGFSSYLWQPKKLRMINGRLARHYVWTMPKHFEGRRDIHAIGAIWLYFLEMKFANDSWLELQSLKNPRLPSKVKSVGYIPAKIGNSSISNPLMHVRNAEFLRSKLGSSTNIKVLLDTRDMLSNETRLAYSRNEISTYCNGWNGTLLINGAMGDETLRTNFYLELFNFINSVDYVVSESFGSHLLYSLSIGIPIRIIQRKKTIDLLRSEFMGVDNRYIDFKSDYENRAEKYFPKMFSGDTLEQSEWRNTALGILGVHNYLNMRNHLTQVLKFREMRNLDFVSQTKAIGLK